MKNHVDKITVVVWLLLASEIISIFLFNSISIAVLIWVIMILLILFYSLVLQLKLRELISKQNPPNSYTYNNTPKEKYRY